MKTFDIFGFYVMALRLRPGAPLFHCYEVNETNGKCRTSTALFVRLYPFRFALGFGHWRASGMSEEQMFKHIFASSLRETDLYGEDGEIDPRYERAARETIAEHAEDPSDEWEILQAIGLDE